MITDRCLGAVCVQLQRVLAMKTHIKSIYRDLVAKQTNKQTVLPSLPLPEANVHTRLLRAPKKRSKKK